MIDKQACFIIEMYQSILITLLMSKSGFNSRLYTTESMKTKTNTADFRFF